jgi:TPR repeat protein
MPEAQYQLARCYDNGAGVPEDNAEAIKWYQKAADQGVAEAQYNLGTFYDSGQVVAQDFQEAAKWYGKAAAQGIAVAQLNLGVMYDNGKGVPEDDIEAFKWIDLAAKQNYGSAASARETLSRNMTAEDVAEGSRRSSEFLAQRAGKPDSP